MKTIKTFENGERLVKLLLNENDNTYTVNLITHNGTTGAIYKSKFYAERKFNEYKYYPLNAIKF